MLGFGDISLGRLEMLFICAAGARDRFWTVWDQIQMAVQVRGATLTKVSVILCLWGGAIVPWLEI